MFVGNKKYDILTSTGWCDFSGVSFNGKNLTFIITLSPELIVRATKEHRFFSKGIPIAVADLTIGDWLDGYDHNFEIINIDVYGDEDVFDVISVNNELCEFRIAGMLKTHNCDEFSFIPNNMQRDFFSAISPTLSTGGSSIITSTPGNDEDLFAQLWHGANNLFDDEGVENPNGEGTNGFFPIMAKWDQHPDRDLKWEKQERAKLGDTGFERENNCEFVSSEETLINGMALKNLTAQSEIFKIDEIRWFAEPQPNHTYGIGWDPSMGDGTGDLAAIQVLDLTTMTQIAEWSSKKSIIEKQTEVLMKILHYIYQTLDQDPLQNTDPEIYWSFENNGMGEAVVITVERIGEEFFPGVFVHEPRTRGGNRKKGLFTSYRSKLNACSNLKRVIESRKLTIHSRPLISELKNYVSTSGSYKAKAGMRDDLISALIIAIRISQVVSDWDPDH